jgi:type IV pilus assembly protein PilB
MHVMADQTSDNILRTLVVSGALSAKKAQGIEQQMSEGKESLYDLLVDTDLVDEETFTKARAQASQMPYVNLADMTIPKEVLEIIPESTARGHSVIAYEQTPDALKVAMADPNDRQIIEFIRKKVDMPVEVALASTRGIRRVWK